MNNDRFDCSPPLLGRVGWGSITYLYHDGFAIETEHAITIIDFWQDPAGVTPALLASPKPIYVLCTHRHQDHFRKEVYAWREVHSNITYVFSNDIRRYTFARQPFVHWLHRYEEYHDEWIHIRTFSSTDIGVSFLIDQDGHRLFHAGDLNNWHFDQEMTPQQLKKMQGEFLKAVDDLRAFTPQVDVAFFPVDGRLGDAATLGPTQFIERIHVGTFIPMHFTFADPAEPQRAFAPVAAAHGVRFQSVSHEGEQFHL